MVDTYWELFFGYSAIWFIVAAILLGTTSEQRRLVSRLEDLEDQMKARNH